ncbi:MAG: DinB family protein [Acidothermaceae bacterium]
MWTAPQIDRTEPPTVGDERASLEAWLDYHRQTLLFKCAGLTVDQLRRQAVEPSSLSLLGLVRHMTEVERAWFRRRLAGLDVPYVYSIDEQPDADFDNVGTAEAEADFAAFTAEIELAREAAAARSLDDTFVHPRLQVEMDLRWVYLHMIEEYARHNGHADLLRERIDGVTGD